MKLSLPESLIEQDEAPAFFLPSSLDYIVQLCLIQYFFDTNNFRMGPA
jgi:hypothetical protein